MSFIFKHFAVVLCYFCVGVASFSSFLDKRVRIGIDYGPRLIGLAYSDIFGVVRPHRTINNHRNLTRIAEEIGQWALSLRASEIVLGVPLDPDGDLSYEIRNLNGKMCLNFSFVLTSVVQHICPFDVKVCLFDERYSTQEAKMATPRRKKRATIDAAAAACILQRYIEDRGEGSLPALSCEYPPPASLSNFDYDVVRKFIRLKYSEEHSPSLKAVRKHVDQYKVYTPTPADAFTSMQSTDNEQEERHDDESEEDTVDQSAGVEDDEHGEEEEEEEDAESATIKQLALRKEMEEKRLQRKKLAILQQSKKGTPSST